MCEVLLKKTQFLNFAFQFLMRSLPWQTATRQNVQMSDRGESVTIKTHNRIKL